MSTDNVDNLIDQFAAVIAAHDGDRADLAEALRSLVDDKCLVFSNPFTKRAADGALNRERDRQAVRARVESLLKLRDRERLSRLLEMGDDSYVCQVIGGPFTTDERPSTWRVVIDGKRSSEVCLSLDMALLRFVELRHNDRNENGRGFVFAARALGVTED